jgi:hypothetical protein
MLGVRNGGRFYVLNCWGLLEAEQLSQPSILPVVHPFKLKVDDYLLTGLITLKIYGTSVSRSYSFPGRSSHSSQSQLVDIAFPASN